LLPWYQLNVLVQAAQVALLAVTTVAVVVVVGTLTQTLSQDLRLVQQPLSALVLAAPVRVVTPGLMLQPMQHPL
jgi:hypothetical protein